jgi:ATP-dependent Lon protease
MSELEDQNKASEDTQPADEQEPRNAESAKGTPVGVNASGEEILPMTIPDEVALLPLRDMVVFPVLISPISVSRESSVKLVDEAVAAGDRIIGVVTLRDSSVDKPTTKDIQSVGCAVVIRMMAKAQEGIKMIVQGIARIELLQITQEEPYLKARVRVISEADEPPMTEEQKLEVEALRRQIGNTFTRIVQLSPQLPDELNALASATDDPAQMTDLIAAHMPIAVSEKQVVLETKSLRERMSTLLNMLTREQQVLELGSKLHNEVASEINKTQRDYYLREQLKAIQKELGDGDDRGGEVEELRKKIDEAKLSEEAQREANRELDRLQRMSPGSPEYTVARSYIDWLVALPWQVSTPDNLDIKSVAQVLDDDHYGLDKVKDRILEYLSVRKFKTEGTIRQPILCLVGPPGVGKTSLGRSIARAMGKKFVRISLGGVRDEAEVRGHRRTYIGALPGQIVQGLKRAGTNNPLFVLDEIDKVSADYRGDPSSALLEVLDPEQNSTFRDNYLDVPFDLSKVLFMTTANMLDTIQPALRDRMEVIEIAGYTLEEKTEIAKRHLIPKELAEHGLTAGQLEFTEAGIHAVISGFTREAGVRNLEREIASICRKATRRFAEAQGESAASAEPDGPDDVMPSEIDGPTSSDPRTADKPIELKPIVVDAALVTEFLGAPRFEHEEVKERAAMPGVVTGLVWTPVGGDIIFIEATKMAGGKNLQLTGQLGDVMKESAQAALSYLRAHAVELGIDPEFYASADLHIHVPAGAIPKDGPSAGVTMASALASLLTGRPIKPLLAMTGEITLSGKVLPVGGIKEKVLAARRAGIRTIILPERNRKDLLEDIPDKLRADMTFIYASDIKQVLDEALMTAEEGGGQTVCESAGGCEPARGDVAGRVEDSKRMPIAAA